jgi:hypothetical protein
MVRASIGVMRVPGVRVGAVVAVVLIAAACSGSSDELVLDESLVDPSSTTTSSTVSVSSSTSEAVTTTSLSELGAAEAEVARVVEEWWVEPFDTSLGEEGLALEQTAGLLRQRTIELPARYEEAGQIHRSRGGDRIEIRAIGLDLDNGQAEVEACAGADYETVDAETGEVLVSDDPEYLTISDFYVQLIEGDWKIVEWVPTQNSDNPGVECEFEGE